jgi:hypothetical protein
MDTVEVVQKFPDIVLMEYIAQDTNKYAQHRTEKVSCPSHFAPESENDRMLVDEMYVVLALFILIGILQTPTQRLYYSMYCLLFRPFFSEMLPLERLELTV